MARKKYTADRRRELLALFANRTESIASFAQAHGVSSATLYKWQGVREDTGGGFVEIRRSEAGPAEAGPVGSDLLVRVGTVYLSFEGLPDAAWLAALVQKLQG